MIHRLPFPLASLTALVVVGILAVTWGFDCSLFSSLSSLVDAAPAALLLANGPVGLLDIKGLIEQVTSSVEGMKKRHESDLAALRQELDRVEAKGNLKGLMGPGPGAQREEPTLQLRTKAEFIEHYRAKAKGEDFEGLTLTEFVRAVVGQKSSPVAQKALAVGTDAAGGYAVPSLVMPEILSAMVPESTLLTAGAGVVPIDVGNKSYTTAAVDVIPSAAWRLENGSVVESEPAFRAVVAAPQSLAFYFKVSRELLADAPNMDLALRVAIGQSFAKALDLAGLRGSGSAPTPRGVLNTVGVNATANGANGASLATTKYANFFAATQAILEANGPMPTAAIMSPRSRVVLGALADSTGQPLQIPHLLQPTTMLATSQIPNNLTVGSSTDCSEVYLGDFRRMAFVMREAVSIQPLAELFAGNGQIAFIGHVRADVAVWHPKAFAVVTGVRP